MILASILTVISFLLLAAHFLRGGHMVIVAVCCLAPFLLFVKRNWARRIVQGLLFAGAAVWGWTAVVLAHGRMMQGVPWLRMALILGTVSAVTLVAGVLLGTESVRKRFGERSASD